MLDRWRAGRRAMGGLVAASLFLLTGCTVFLFSELGREDLIEKGSVQGALVRADTSEAASFAQVRVPGSARSVRADSQGRFAVRGLLAGSWALRIVDDPDGDGWPDRALAQGVLVPRLRHSTSPLELATGPQGEPEVAGVDLGELQLAPSARLAGEVYVDEAGIPPSSRGLIGRVIVTRRLRIEVDVEGRAEEFALGSEAVTSVDASGRWQVDGVAGGELRIIALLYEDLGGGQLGELVEVAAPVVVTAAPKVEGLPPDEVDEVVVPVGVVEPEDGKAPVALRVTPPPTEDVYVLFAPPGRELPPCEDPEGASFPPTDQTYDGGPYDHVRVSTVEAASSTVQLEAPLGTWDLRVCSGTRYGLLYGQVLTPPAQTADVPIWGPVALGAEDGACTSVIPLAGETCSTVADCGEGQLCLASGERTLAGPELICHEVLVGDCDGDGVRGLPTPRADDPAAWDACALTCSGRLGPALDGLTCTSADVAYDCDDDGDGQADVDEEPCYSRAGQELGTDLDGDGLCSPFDAYPQCAANTAEACVAGTNDLPGGSGEERAPLAFDTSFGEAGTVAFGQNASFVEVNGSLYVEESRTFYVGGAVDFGSGLQATVWSSHEEGPFDALTAELPAGQGTITSLAVDVGEGSASLRAAGTRAPGEGQPQTGRLWVFALDASGTPTISDSFSLAAELAAAGETLIAADARAVTVMTPPAAQPFTLVTGVADVELNIEGPAQGAYFWAPDALDPFGVIEAARFDIDVTGDGEPTEPGALRFDPEASRLFAAGRRGAALGAGSPLLAVIDPETGLEEDAITPGRQGHVHALALGEDLDTGERLVMAGGLLDDEVSAGQPMAWLVRAAPGDGTTTLEEVWPPFALDLAGAQSGEVRGVSAVPGRSSWLAVGEVVRGGQTDMAAWLLEDGRVAAMITEDEDLAGASTEDAARGISALGGDVFLVTGMQVDGEGSVGTAWRLVVSGDGETPPEPEPDPEPEPIGEDDCLVDTSVCACDGAVPVCEVFDGRGECACDLDTFPAACANTVVIRGSWVDGAPALPDGVMPACVESDVGVSLLGGDLASLSALRWVGGELRVDDVPEPGPLDLGQLQSATSLVIAATGLVGIDLSALTAVTDNLQISDNASLSALSLSLEPPPTVGLTLAVFGNPQLCTADLLGAFGAAGGWDIRENGCGAALGDCPESCIDLEGGEALGICTESLCEPLAE